MSNGAETKSAGQMGDSDQHTTPATTARRLTFTAISGHPGGRFARTASVPAGQPVRAVEVQPGTRLLLTSVDGIDDYETEVGPQDAVFPAGN